MTEETPSTKRIPNNERITLPYMTRYEYARIIGTRALQISKGAPLQVEAEGETDPCVIALKELEQNKIDYIILRVLPNGTHEEWSISELEIDYEVFK